MSSHTISFVAVHSSWKTEASATILRTISEVTRPGIEPHFFLLARIPLRSRLWLGLFALRRSISIFRRWVCLPLLTDDEGVRGDVCCVRNSLGSHRECRRETKLP